jgi:hypothetical protein
MNTNGRKTAHCPTAPAEDPLQRITITLDVIADHRNEGLAADTLLNLLHRLRHEGIDVACLTLEISSPITSPFSW